ncbi:uncharacterized protein METZ01_LOCUS419517, partial [marine metagenome]
MIGTRNIRDDLELSDWLANGKGH